MTPDERSAEAEALRQRLDELESLGAAAMDLEGTALVPVGPEALMWLWRCLQALEYGAQSLRMPAHFTVQQNAGPERAALPAAEQHWRSHGFTDWKVLCTVPDYGEKVRNITEARQALAESVQTPFALWVDSDVRTPAGAVRAMLDYLKETPDAGAVGVPYDLKTNHLQFGCTMMRTDLLSKIRWEIEGCECRAAMGDIVHEGYRVGHLPGFAACHMRLERTA